jgi:HSP20 family molecular chaperone IbpA
MRLGADETTIASQPPKGEAMTTNESDHGIPRLPLDAHVSEEPGAYVVELDVSGFDQGELDLTLHGRSLTVVGERDDADLEQGFGVHERLEETFSLPDDVLTDRIEAFFGRGKLEIKVPRCGLQPDSRRVPVRRTTGVINADATPC